MNHSPKASRSGTVLVCVMACMVVAVAITTTTIQSTLQSRRAILDSVNVQQAEYLCEAAAMRAHQQILTDQDYWGETWSPNLRPASQLEATIEISGKRSNDGTRFNCVAKCRLMDTDKNSVAVQRSLHFAIKLTTDKREKK